MEIYEIFEPSYDDVDEEFTEEEIQSAAWTAMSCSGWMTGGSYV